MSETQTPRPWDERTSPTPEQLAEWIKVCTDEERLEFAETALRNQRDALTCLMWNHAGRLGDDA